MTILLGAHVSITGGYIRALHKIRGMGGSSLQIFSTSPRGWRQIRAGENNMKKFAETKRDLQIGPVYFHASYLINLADGNRIGQLSKRSLIAELSIAEKLEIKGSIVHLGSYKGEETKTRYQTLIGNIIEVLEKTPTGSLFIIENAGNRKIGQSLSELGHIVRDVNNDRVRICLDTCHLYSAGYNLSTEQKLKSFLSEFDKKIGLHRLECFHFNDSKDPFNSGRDRHENIGKGTIPVNEFRLIMRHPRLTRLPFIIETPGFDNKGPDKKNLDILQYIAS